MKCRVCGSKYLTMVLSLGETPLANSYPKTLEDQTTYYPLELYQCECGNVQLGAVVNPNIMFKKYLYSTSASFPMIQHFEEYANTFKPLLSAGDLIVDIGSNDGILLKHFKKMGMRVVGVEPATNIAEIARKEGIPTFNKFFTNDLAKTIVKKEGHAKIITCNNTFAHIDDLDEIIKGVKTLLDKNGLFVIEVQYLPTVMDKKYFDQIYHEHVNYWTIQALSDFFELRGMSIAGHQAKKAHGCTMRVWVTKGAGGCICPNEKLDFEKFANDLLKNKVKLNKMLSGIKLRGKSIACYGAPAKVTTLMHYFGIGSDVIDFVVDDSPLKQGRFIPGKRIPIYSSAMIYDEKPDYILITAWNFADSIIKNHPDYKGKWIIPCPKPKII